MKNIGFVSVFNLTEEIKFDTVTDEKDRYRYGF